MHGEAYPDVGLLLTELFVRKAHRESLAQEHVQNTFLLRSGRA